MLKHVNSIFSNRTRAVNQKGEGKKGLEKKPVLEPPLTRGGRYTISLEWFFVNLGLRMW